jgi:hypothetical protein
MEIKFQNSQPIRYNETGSKPVSFRGWQDQSDSTKVYVGQEVGSAISSAISALILAPVVHFFSLKLFRTKDEFSPELVEKIADTMINDPKNNFKNSKFKGYLWNNKPEPEPTTIDSLKNFFSDHFNPQSNIAEVHESRPSVLLHELGHAIDWNKSAFSKLLANTRFKAMAAAGILIPIAFAHKKSDGQDTFGDFLNKHIGAISFLSFVPTLITEATASLRGLGYLKKYAEQHKSVTQEMIKNYKTRMGWAYGTYAATALLTPIAIKLGVMVKDKIVSSGDNNQEIQQPYVRYYNQQY